MDKETSIKLSINKVIESIKPVTHYGRVEKEKFVLYTSSTKNKLVKDLSLLYNTAESLKEEDLSFILSTLESINNIELIISKLQYSNLEVYEIFEIKKVMYFYQKLSKMNTPLPYIKKDSTSIFKMLNPEKRKGYTFYIYDSYSKKLKILRNKELKIKEKIKEEENRLKQDLKNQYNILMLSNEFVVPKFKKSLIEELTHSGIVVMTRESFSNVYFSIKDSPKLEILKKQMHEIKKDIECEERKILKDLSSRLREKLKNLKVILKKIGQLDFLLAKVKFVKTFNYCIPTISDEIFSFESLSYLPLYYREDYTPINAEIPKGLTILVGTNMGGKTTFLKTIGLTEFMLKYGLLLPAKRISIPLLDDIFFVNEDIESESLSSFAINVERLIRGLNIKKRALILIDEFAKGTNPIEGDALAKSMAEWVFLNRKENFTIFATHFTGPVNNNYNLLKVGKIKRKFTSIYNAIDHSISKYTGKFPMEALKIAQFIGLNKKIIKNAKEKIKDDLSQWKKP